MPDLVSGIVALGLVRPILAADLQHNHSANLATWINFALLFYVTAVFANIGLGGNTALLKTPSSILVMVVVGMANLNARRYGEIVVPILILFGAFNVTSASAAMGLSGFALITLSAVGAAFLIDMGRVKEAMLSKPAA
ncbi:hypothetical protein GCM10010873_17210 [Cypionkella aquatica]|uniref:Uncharacterized protein n=1 Tax=Cypionkella aquatica TaxID=1756042 RepID=A0AA37X016_9RHOB|nr:hypothetical protein GCM10010873_17210 [Cypionkella aquatica]